MRKGIILLAFFACQTVVGQGQKILSLKTDWKFTIGDREEYKEIDYDDSSWERVYAPSSWEDEGFLNYNGFAWYRFTFDGAELEGFDGLTLNLGYIDDVHEAYLNEELIGFKGSFPPNYYTAYNALNVYSVPEEFLNRNGRNTIAVKVYDLTGEGGIVNGNLGIYFSPEASSSFFNLSGIWKFSKRRTNGWEDRYFNDDQWENIVVPSKWRSKYLKHYGGFAFYRKEFVLPNHLKDQDVYIILGRIDDFDRTYLNGELIGETNDGLRVGRSESWREYRVYEVDRELLNQNGSNVIAVEVEDIGGDAGIYEGNVGIVSRDISRRDLWRLKD